jgi:transglutaminase/protease-like cytokinesis protein 3
MKHSIKIILLLLFSFVAMQTNGQSTSKIDELISGYPVQFDSYEELTKQISKDFRTDAERARAAFAWIAMNISYDTKGINKVQKVQFTYSSEEDLKTQKAAFRKDLASQVLKKRKALCEGYATLYQEICKLLAIECVIVPGIAKRFSSEIGKRDLPSNHVWNAIKINGEWKLVDITWAAGSVDFSKMLFRKDYLPAYYDCSPEEFALKHYPDDSQYLLLDSAFSKEDFAFQPAVYNAFIGHGYQIISPKKGILTLKKGSDLQFRIVNVSPQTQISYYYSQTKYAQKAQVKQNGKETSFLIPAPQKGKKELTIYFDNEAVLTYLVVSKPTKN